LPSFGQKLKSEREKRSITLEQISSSTKIGKRMLQALEEENFNQLPGGIFNKGFVRAYARHVGLDEDQAIADYLEASGQNVVAKADTEVEGKATPEEPREPSAAWQVPWGSLAAVLLLLALALSLWSRRQHKNEAFSPALPPIPAEKITANPSAGANTGSPASPNVGSADDLAQTTPPTKDVSSEPKPAFASVKNASAAAPEIAATTPAGKFTVVILARDDSWLSITADGKNVFQDTLLAENQRAIHGQKEVVIRAGNTGGLDFVFNGKKLASQGDYGEVKTLTFGSGGLQPNAPVPPVSQ
jgi:cytoskeleton protein RodZ